MTDPTDLEVEAAVEETVLRRLERLGDRQGEIFDAVRADRRRANFLLFVGFVIMSILAAFVYVTQAKLDAANAVRTSSRRTACNDANLMRIAHNRLVLDIAGFDPDSGLPTATWTSRPPEALALLRPRLERNLIPLRDCSSDGVIQAFYESGGRDGVRSIDATDDDFREAVTP